MNGLRWLVAFALVLVAVPSPNTRAQEASEIVIGGLAALDGPFAGPGAEAFRGMELAITEVDGVVAGKAIRLVKEGSDATPALAGDKARKLIEQDKVDLLIGPLSADEGLAVRDYAKTVPHKVFLNGSAAAPEATRRDPAPNFYRFSTDAAQWMAGLGTYAFRDKGYARMAVVAEDYSFPHAQVGGFMTEYCRAGGTVVGQVWVPLGTIDFDTVVAALPPNVDALYVALDGANAVAFLRAYDRAGGEAPLVAGSLTIDQSVLSTTGAIAARLIGVPSAGPIADANPDPAWRAFVAAYKAQFPDGLAAPSLFAHAYYVAAKAALLALQQIDGDLSANQAKLKQALAGLRFETPTGPVRLDQNRNAIANVFLTEVAASAGGTLHNKLVKVLPNVDQTLGVPDAEYLARGPLTRDNPGCP